MNDKCERPALTIKPGTRCECRDPKCHKATNHDRGRCRMNPTKLRCTRYAVVRWFLGPMCEKCSKYHNEHAAKQLKGGTK